MKNTVLATVATAGLIGLEVVADALVLSHTEDHAFKDALVKKAKDHAGEAIVGIPLVAAAWGYSEYVQRGATQSKDEFLDELRNK